MAEEEAGEEVAEPVPPEPRMDPAADELADEFSADSDVSAEPPGELSSLDFQELEDAPAPAPASDEPSEEPVMDEFLDIPRTAQDLESVYEIPIQVSAVLGKSPMHVSQLLKMGRGAVIELDRNVGEAIDIYINNRLVARGEVVVVEERLGVTMTEIIKTEKS